MSDPKLPPQVSKFHSFPDPSANHPDPSFDRLSDHGSEPLPNSGVLERGAESAPHDQSLPHSHVHAHIHSETSLRQLVNRLSRIEGHIRGVKTMVQENRPCPEVLIQLAAVRGAIDRVARLVLDEHLNECVLRAAQDGNIEAELAELKAALDRFL